MHILYEKKYKFLKEVLKNDFVLHKKNSNNI